MWGVLFIIVAFLVALELGVHMIYHYKTGKAGLYDPPFAYLKDIFKPRKKRMSKEDFERLSNAMTDAVIQNDKEKILDIIDEVEAIYKLNKGELKSKLNKGEWA